MFETEYVTVRPSPETIQVGVFIAAWANVAVHPVAALPPVIVKAVSLPITDGLDPHDERTGGLPRMLIWVLLDCQMDVP